MLAHGAPPLLADWRPVPQHGHANSDTHFHLVAYQADIGVIGQETVNFYALFIGPGCITSASGLAWAACRGQARKGGNIRAQTE